MDISKILETVKNYIGDYINMIFTVFTAARTLHQETVKNYSENAQGPLIGFSSKASPGKTLKKFPPQIIANSFISIFIGSFLHRLNPSFNASDDPVRWIILVLMFWVMYLLVVFGLFKLVKGRLNLLNFLAVGLQINASAYIVSSFLSLLASMFLSNTILFSMPLPMVVYIGVQSLLLIVLTPISLSEFIN